MKEPT